MARVTVEDCIDKVDSPYELVLVAKERATQLNSGIEPTLERDNDKHTVIALTEIYGIGNKRAEIICDSAGIDKTILVKNLSESELEKIRNEVANFNIEGDLRREVSI